MARQTTKPTKSAEHTSDVVAAGGVVIRERQPDPERQSHGHEIAVIHRPKYEDWSLPKGKLEQGEKFKQAALREVWEETGMECKTEVELSPISYLDRKARSKLVRYWLMTPVSEGDFEPHEEVDEVRWVTAAEAQELLTYDHDRELVLEAVEAWRARSRSFRKG